VFVFAGGPVHRYADLQRKVRDGTQAKLPDFVGRLRHGYVDVSGFDPPVGTHLIRRAMILRSLIVRRYKTLVDAAGCVRIDEGVLRAFLHVPAYRHGARSLEGILEMSRLLGRRQFDPSLLPPTEQLTVHVDADDFLSHVQHHHALGEHLEILAQEIHGRYLKAELDRGQKLGDRPSLREWKDLDELYRNSNREQAAYYPALLAAVGCDIVPGPAKSSVTLTAEEIDRMARMEHERWIEERRLKQPDHPDLKSWDELDDVEKQKDTRVMKELLDLLENVLLALRRRV
jgi:hypothetical protein